MKKAILLAAMAAASCTGFAQDALATHPDAIADKCKENNSVFYQFAKSENYADAYQPWYELYTTCPEYSKNIYKYGAYILNWKIKSETDAAKQAEYVDLLMKMYDDRIKYYGNDLVMPTERILAYKAMDYINAPTPKDPLKKNAYEWLSQSLSKLGKEADPSFAQYYIWIACNLYRQDNSRVTSLIDDYNKANDILVAQISDSASTYAESAKAVKATNDQQVASTGALSGETLDKIYGPQIDAKKNDIDYLANTLKLYESVNATESEVYFKASEYAHMIKPTEVSAAGCANMYVKKKDYSKAITFFEDAVKYATDNNKKAKYEYAMATIYASYIKNPATAREHARASLRYNPNQGGPYILIGKLYAGSHIYSDPVLSKTVYWVAVDKFNKARQVDPSCAAEANRLISRYSQYFPADNDIFMHPDLNKGASFTVGGWIGESTICR